MRCIPFSIFAAGVLACGPAHAAMDMFLCLPAPLVGETTDSGFPNCIDVLAVSDAGFQESDVAEPRDLRITKYQDLSSVPLRRHFVNGDNIDEAILYVRPAGSTVSGPNGAFISIKLIDPRVTSFASNFTGGEDRATETLSLRGRQIQYMYRRRLPTGQLQAPTYSCWDVTTGIAFANPC
jgi:type VI protein secretion system component Hcp